MKAGGRSERATLTDRFALAFISGLTALATGFLVWLVIVLNLLRFDGDLELRFWPVPLFTAVMAVLGFLLLENFVASVVGWLIRGFLRIVRYMAY